MTPVALFLVCDPITDHNGALSKAQISYFEKVVKTTHRVFIEVVQDGRDPEQYLSIAREKAGQKIDLFFQFGHGDEDGIRLSRGKTYRALDIKPEIYRGSMTDAPAVYYVGCKLRNLAQKTAEIAGIRAFGFQHICRGEILTRMSGKYQVLGFHQDQYSLFDEFGPHGERKPHPLSAPEILPKICELALLDDPSAQNALGFLADTPEERLKWHRTAAENGHVASRKFLLLQENAELLGSSIREKWFEEILPDFVGNDGICSADQFARKGDLNFARRIYQNIRRSKKSLSSYLAAARGMGQIYQRKGDTRRALQFYAKAAGKKGIDLPDTQIQGRELVAMYRKLEILAEVVKWAKESASWDDLTARKWLDEIYEARDMFSASDLDAVELLATFYEWGEEESDRPKAAALDKLMASLS